MVEGGWFQCGLTEGLILALLVVVVLYLVYGGGKKYRLPPGPTPLPLLGNLLTFMRAKKTIPEVLVDLGEKYGPIYRIHFGFYQAVVLNSVELIKEALLSKPTDFAGRPKSYTIDILSDGYKDILAADYSPTWRLQRKIASKAMKQYLSGPQLDDRIHKASVKVTDLMKTEKEPFNPKQYLSLMIINFICAFCFGTTYELDDPEVKEILNVNDTFLELSANGLPEDLFPALRHLHLKKSTKVISLIQEFLNRMRKMYKEHQDSYQPGVLRDFTDCMIAAEKEAQEEEEATVLSSLTNTHFVQILSDIFGAGVDTSRFTLLWAVLHVACYPDIQEKCFDEIVKTVGQSRMPGYADKERLPYTQATLYESMRLGTVAPSGGPRVAMLNSQIGGYDIPKGTMVITNLLALHKDPKCWPEPDDFRPERFLNEDGTMAPKPENFLPFSMGRRVCLGESVAKPELLLFFAILLQRLKFSLPSGEKPSLDPTGGIAGFIPHPYKVVVKARF